MPRATRRVMFGLMAALSCAVLLAQGPDVFNLSRDHPAIQYSRRPTRDAIARLNERLNRGDVLLTFDPPPRGYLASVLKALDISPASQVLVFSESSLQREHISMATPRAIYFNDTVAVAWAKGATEMEAAVLDATQGVQFYSLPLAREPSPQFVKRTDCLECHLMPPTLGVPGFFTMSQLPLSDNQNDYARGWEMDQSTPIADRWGGWYVTGAEVPAKHLGNVAVSHVPKSYGRADVAPKLVSGAKAFDASTYLTPESDVVALMVLNHQLHMANLLTRLGWAARIAEGDQRPGARLPDVGEEVRTLVDYMLFVDEAALPSAVKGSTTFAQEFAARGPRDGQGRSLRDLDLTRRLLRYPCSYLIYSETFDALPASAKDQVYRRLWAVLSGREADRPYARLLLADRRAVVEILRETKKDLPAYFQAVTR